MDEFAKEKYPNKSIQSPPESIQSLLGFKENLTPTWVESVRRIIINLPSLNLGGDLSPSLKQAESKKDEAVTKILGDISLLNVRINKLNTERKHALNEYLNLKGNIRVFCRIRPLLGEERYGYERPVVTSDSSNVFLKINENKIKQYNYDKVFHPHSTQDEFFSEIEPVIKSALDGYNVCIVAYGQTGTGKTYTMEGKPECPGVVPRGIEALFEQALESNYRPHFSFSMLEIYMGRLRDLLVSQNKKPRVHKAPCLSIQMNPNGGIEIENLVSVKVSDYKQVQKLYKLGSRFRSTAPTMSNATSSRSHCLIRMSITCSGVAVGRQRETNKIWMVDLGGSERLIKTQASGRRLEEGKAINLSLSALGDVISALQSKKPHVPYRNSKLTQVLRDSLGLDSKTLMLVHVSPKQEDMCETACSLGFATRVKSIHLGSEEPTEMRAKKELAMAELLRKVEDFESECQYIKKDIERLNKKLKHLIGAEPPSERNRDSSHPSQKMRQHNEKDKVRYVEGSSRASANLPRFMRPTVCSQRRADTNHQISLSVSKKPPIPPKKRRPSSVYAESLTYPAKGEGWQSEHGSECSISTSSHLNWNFSADGGTECNQETSEYEIKKIIFPEPEKSPKNLAAYLADKSVNELEHGQKNILNQKKIFVIDNWLQLQMEEQKKSHTQWSKRVLAVPSEAKNLSSDTIENLNDFKKEIKLNKTVENLDEAMNTREPHDNMELLKVKSFSVSSSSDIANNKHHQHDDSGQSDERIKYIEVDKPQCATSSNEIEAGIGTSLTERGISIKKENSTLVKIYNDDLVVSTRHNGNNEEIFLHCVRSRRSLPMVEDITKSYQKTATLEDSAVPTANSQKENHKKGTIELLGQTVQMLCASALLGLGIQSLGFDHDFFQGLML